MEYTLINQRVTAASVVEKSESREVPHMNSATVQGKGW